MGAGEIVLAVSGIVVSGVLGPLVNNLTGRDNERRAFQRGRDGSQRDELRKLLDDAAVLLSEGPRVHRRAATRPEDAEAKRTASMWSDSVFPMRERLTLRLPSDDEVVVVYDDVREAVTALIEHPTDSETVAAYELARDTFLDAARAALAAPIREERSWTWTR